MDLNIKNIDITKSDLGLGHTYVPQTVFNLAQKEDDRISMDIDFFKVGEKMKYTILSESGFGGLDIQRIFRDKVKAIRNFKVNGNPVKTSTAFLAYPSSPELEAIIMDVALYIVKADSLNEDERKN